MALLAARLSPALWHWRSLLRILAAAAAIAGCDVFVIAPLTGHFSGAFEDFAAYFGAAHAAAAHGDIYAAFVGQQQNVALSGYDYPPIVAAALLPLAWLSPHAAAAAWLLVGATATVTGCVVVARSVLPATWPRLELAILTAVLYAAATYNLWHGQMNPLVFVLLAFALRSWLRGEQVRCGALLGVAAAIKLAPVVLLVLLLRRRWWRGAAAAVLTLALLTGAGLLVFGAHTSAEYVRSVLPVLSRDDGWLYNQSWDGVVNRLADHSVLVFQPDVTAIRAIVLTLSAVTVMGAAWAVGPGHAARDVRAGQFAGGVVAMLLAGSLTWYAHEVHLVIAFAAAAALIAQRRHGLRVLLSALIAALFTCAVLAPALIATASMRGIAAVAHSPWWFALLIATSLPALSTAALLVALIRSSRVVSGRVVTHGRPATSDARFA